MQWEWLLGMCWGNRRVEPLILDHPKSWDYARATTDSMPTCSRKWSWHHHQSATAVLKTRWTNIYCRDSNFCRQQEQVCGQRQSSYTPNSTAVMRNWRRRLHSSCRLDSQCHSDQDEEEEDHPKSQAVVVLKKGWSLLTKGHIYIHK